MRQRLATSSTDPKTEIFRFISLSRSSRVSGFTLIEILVALAILAVVSTTLMRQMSNSSAQISSMEKRTFARMLAQNKLNETRLGLISPGDPQFSEIFAGQHWRVQTLEEEIADSGVVRLEVLVYDDEQLDAPAYRLIGYDGHE